MNGRADKSLAVKFECDSDELMKPVSVDTTSESDEETLVSSKDILVSQITSRRSKRFPGRMEVAGSKKPRRNIPDEPLNTSEPELEAERFEGESETEINAREKSGETMVSPGISDPAKWLKFSITQEEVDKLRSKVMAQVTNRNSSGLLYGLDKEQHEVYRLLERTIRDNEGHSILLIGPRASGKTAVVAKSLRSLSLKYPKQFITVKLNGYHQSNDNMALREIARQLDEQLKLGFGIDATDTFEKRGLNDTFQTILDILDNNKQFVASDNEEKTLRTVAVVFIIEEFERFTYHNRQTLLYNLFDLSQNSTTAVSVVGITTKITAREMLEKRVKSRFSQRVIQIANLSTLDEFVSKCQENLMIREVSDLNQQYVALWNEEITRMFQTEISVRKILFQNFYTVKNIKEFLNCAVYPLSRISVASPFPKAGDLGKYFHLLTPNYLQSTVDGLSELETCLLVCAARLIEKLGLDIVNYNLVYEEYTAQIKRLNASTSLSSTTNSSGNMNAGMMLQNHKAWSKDACKYCWERLQAQKLIIDSVSTSVFASGPVAGKLASLGSARLNEDSRMVSVAINLEELGHLIPSSSFIKSMTTL
ncbi:hypothetical protein BABINDRAFT_161553 [Babjeviella inositovora NRRL Y-12698]|uniref:Uncharacterized protein n=1 Tax=Babjeviella inositovora NRRL Y-12698 TaxID=984486 RepID=A0A1E3QQE4_9ASCO|nr:uncharacterized protein BABINDRAFT_161553 [Babjeviella inositovora NRRL Y-12698]ODQ79880.1 hypothetical protein BABINDRAFT_161553 [Babjeviella inositovora NRRL Y-12698]